MLSGILFIHHDPNGDVLIAPASPRLEQAMIWLTTDPVCAKYKAKADSKLLEYTLVKRMDELIERRKEQTNELRAMRTGLFNKIEGEDDIQNMLSELQQESKATNDELR